MEFTKLKKHIDVTSEYKALVREMIENHEKEEIAAIKIQKVYRGFKDRKLYLIFKYFLKFAKNQLQLFSCIYKFKKLKQQKLEEQLISYLSDNALRIQKTYRGFYSRKYIHDFYQRKKDILKLDQHMKEQHKKMLFEVEERRKQQLMYEEKLKEEKIKKVTKHLHHLISTKAQGGIYNPKIENIIKEQKKKNLFKGEKADKMQSKKNTTKK